MSLKNTNKIETNTYELEIEISAEKFEEAVQKAFLRAKNKVNVPGFRKGKAPRKVIEKTYGEGVFYEDAVNMLYPAAVDEAIKEASITIVSRPDVEITDVNKATGVKLKAKCITMPEVEVSNYLGIEVEKIVNAVTDEDIDKDIEKIREKNVRILDIDDRAAQMGDEVIIDFEGFESGVAFEGGKAEKFNLSLGSGQFIPGFEEKVVGHSIGEEFDIDVTFPEEYSAKELAGKPVVFKIKLHEIKAKELPELDDEFVKDTTDFETVDELKVDIRKKLEEAAEKKSEKEVEEKLFDVVVGNMKAEIPEVMYDNRATEMVQELEQRLSPQGITLDVYLQYTGQNYAQLMATFKEQAKTQVQLRLALEKIVEVENVEATEEEIDAEFVKLAETYNMEVDKIKEYIHAEDIKKDVCVGKAVDLIKNSAKIK